MTQTGIFEGLVQIPYAYAGVPNAVGTYGSANAAADEPMQTPTICPMILGDYNRIMNQAAALGKGAALLPLLAFALISASVKEQKSKRKRQN